MSVARVFGVVGLVLAMPAAGHAEGAIAKSDRGAVGISYNYRGPRAADARALEECEGDCRVVLRYSGECAAIAIGRGGGGGWARAERRGRAEGEAVEQCRAQGNRGCEVSKSACDER